MSFFETTRLIARRFESRDLEPFAAYRADPETARYQMWEPFTLEEAREFLGRIKDRTPGEPGWFQFALELKASGELIGDLALRTNAKDSRLGEIGYTIARRHWNQGYASEAVRGLLDYAFGPLKMHRVMASIDPRNRGSRRVLEKVGMRREGYFVESLWNKGEWTDDEVFAVLAREWP
jgi:RimJ/RimL family protein N-acetyltransferase